MKKLYIWEVSTTLDSANIMLSHPMQFKVATDEMSFAKAESAAIENISELMKTERYSNRVWSGTLNSVNYVDHAMTMLMEETDEQPI